MDHVFDALNKQLGDMRVRIAEQEQDMFQQSNCMVQQRRQIADLQKELESTTASRGRLHEAVKKAADAWGFLNNDGHDTAAMNGKYGTASANALEHLKFFAGKPPEEI